jgi:threonine dehydrogenase-like Zn-dependent dehydrogenase
MFEDNTCDFCVRGLQSSCRHGGLWGTDGIDGGQGEAVRVPQAQGTLVKLPVGQDSSLLPSLLTLSDVFPTGHHAAVTAGVGPGARVTVIGDGAVGVLAVLAARRLGAERIILMGGHPERTSLGRAFGATDVVAERGQQGVEMVRELTDGDGTEAVLECVGLGQSIGTAFGVVRDGGVVSRIGAPQYDEVPARNFEHEMEARRTREEALRKGEQVPVDSSVWTRNITLTGGMTPARGYIEELLPDVLDGKVEPGRVLDRTVDLSAVPDGYRAMADREALKVMVVP